LPEYECRIAERGLGAISLGPELFATGKAEKGVLGVWVPMVIGFSKQTYASLAGTANFPVVLQRQFRSSLNYRHHQHAMSRRPVIVVAVP
jgi:hypothetical protein